MRKIIVAGAGHGGLTCAYILAKNGYDVSVYEKAKREELGHDWHDMLLLDAFDVCGIKRPPESETTPPLPTAAYCPDKKGKLKLPPDKRESLVYMDRRYLDKYLVEQCEAVGVKFYFGHSCIAPIVDGDKVTGIKVSHVADDGDNSRQIERRTMDVLGDLVIDSAGMYSSIKANLPDDFGIKKSFAADEIFYTYRGYYERERKLTKIKDDNNVYLYHCGIPGMSWVVRREKTMDCMVGCFVPFDKKDIREAMDDYQATHRDLGTKLIRGGIRANIPLTNTSGCLACNGYAAVGDAVAMTEPLTGSGMTLAMKGGKCLADAVIAAGDKAYTRESLWSYQYDYFTTYLFPNLGGANIRKLLNFVDYKDIDTVLHYKVILPKQWKVLGKAVVSLVKNTMIANKVQKTLPKKYDAKKIAKWEEEYKKL